MPLPKGPIIPENGGAAKPKLQSIIYLPLLGGVSFGQTFCLKNQSQKSKNYANSASCHVRPEMSEGLLDSAA